MPKLSHAVALAALVSATTVYADEAQWAREANDRAEIQTLMWHYVRALDTLNVDDYVQVFTEDAQFGNAKGREAIRALVAGIKAAREKNTEAGKPVTPTYQSINNMNIEFTSPDHAVVNGYYMAVFGGSPPRVATAGVERNEVVKVNGQWLIAVRTVGP